MPSVLFVCTANQYRSPLAVAYFRRELELHGVLAGWNVESAGTWARPGLPAAHQAQQAALKSGLSLNGHVTRQVSLEMLGRFDLVLAMELGHVEALRTEFPFLANRIYLLTEVAARFPYNIPDPFLSGEGWSEIPAELHKLIRNGFDKIAALARAVQEDQNNKSSAA